MNEQDQVPNWDTKGSEAVVNSFSYYVAIDVTEIDKDSELNEEEFVHNNKAEITPTPTWLNVEITWLDHLIECRLPEDIRLYKDRETRT